MRFLGGPLGSAEEFIRGVLGFIRGIWFSVTTARAWGGKNYIINDGRSRDLVTYMQYVDDVCINK